MRGEFAENVDRDDFAPSEMVAIDEALEPLVRTQAKERQQANVKQGCKKPVPETCRNGNAGDARDHVARYCGKTYEKAKAVAVAERNAGRPPKEMEKAKGVPGNQYTGKVVPSADARGPKTLAELGISYDQSSQWPKACRRARRSVQAELAGPEKPTTTGIIRGVEFPPVLAFRNGGADPAARRWIPSLLCAQDDGARDRRCRRGRRTVALFRPVGAQADEGCPCGARPGDEVDRAGARGAWSHPTADRQ